MKFSAETGDVGVPPRIHRAMGGARWGVVLLGLGGALLLWWQRPSGQFYYPRCALLAMTGLKCPGCGVMRATHFLLRGEWEVAWRMNALWVCLMPLWLWSGAAWVARRFGWRWWNPLAMPWVWGGVAGLACVYGVLRNLPWWNGMKGW